MPPRPGAPRKYQPLVDYLTAHPDDRVTLTLPAIEAIIGKPLPAGARRRDWWQSHSYRSLCALVQAAGWRVVLDGFWGRHPVVTFVRDRADAASAGRA